MSYKPSRYHTVTVCPTTPGSIIDPASMEQLSIPYAEKLRDLCADLIEEFRKTGKISLASEDRFLDTLVLTTIDLVEEWSSNTSGSGPFLDETTKREISERMVASITQLTRDTLHRARNLIEAADNGKI